MADQVEVVKVEGRIDASSAPGMEAAINAPLERGVKKIVVDLSGVEYMSSAGLRVLLASLKKVRSLGGEMRLAGMQPFVKEVFDMTGFSRLFSVSATVEEAVKSLSS
ncbi:anti-anti-sigma factor [Methanolinea mesophila]|uniref:STAS domain-containing protein n=1 Tax=Methanolinea mesophila TaxID=547055 RepID=UPI001AE62855|nr:STAS domain-containing protein [Methanolinea mesophila]MBP1928858.1 anti-anti-sigma factor [Methanolinea mesophila]